MSLAVYILALVSAVHKFALQTLERILDFGVLTMNDFTPEAAQAFFEIATTASNEAFSVQASYFEAALTRNTACMTELSEARINSFKEMGEAKTFTQAFESNLAFEESVRDKLQQLQDTNSKAWDVLQADIEKAYATLAPVADAADVKETKKK